MEKVKFNNKNIHQLQGWLQLCNKKDFTIECEECNAQQKVVNGAAYNDPMNMYKTAYCKTCEDYIMVCTEHMVDDDPDDGDPFGPMHWEKVKDNKCLRCNKSETIFVDFRNLTCKLCKNDEVIIYV
jgi:hypothetical protein